MFIENCKKKSLRKKRGIKCENKIQPLTLSTNQDQPDVFFKHDKMKAVFHEWYFVCTHFDIYYVLNLWITCCVICQSQKGFFFFFFCCRKRVPRFYKQRRKSYALSVGSLCPAQLELPAFHVFFSSPFKPH